MKVKSHTVENQTLPLVGTARNVPHVALFTRAGQGLLKDPNMSLGYDPELPAGFQDADIEMRDLQIAANRPEPRPHITSSNLHTEKAIAMKDGTTIAKGAPVQFIQDKPWLCYVQGARHEAYRVRVKNAFTPPSLEELEEAASDGVCPTVADNTAEPDGWDSDGSPSWLLALGMI